MSRVNRYFVTGTDTDVGKTRVTAALARALVRRDGHATVVKLVQTGLPPGARGDAADAAELAGCAAYECARFELAADPWNAALAAGMPPLSARELSATLRRLPGPLAIEGLGGISVPLSATESLVDVVTQAECTVIVVVGLRLGCINHALLTLDYLARRGCAVAGTVLVERFGPTTDAYRDQVRRALEPYASLFGVVSHDADPARSVVSSESLFRSL